MSKKAILVITDGIGYSSKTEHNAMYNAQKPTYDKLFKEVPDIQLEQNRMITKGVTQ